MAYNTAGLRRMVEGAVNQWVYDTTDAVATVTTGSYVTDGTSSSTNSTPGRGMQIGDVVLVRVVGALTTNGIPPATCTDQAWCFVSSVNTTTGACALTAV